MNRYRIISAVINDDDLECAINSATEMIFLLNINILNLKNQADTVHKAGKKLFFQKSFDKSRSRMQCIYTCVRAGLSVF